MPCKPQEGAGDRAPFDGDGAPEPAGLAVAARRHEITISVRPALAKRIPYPGGNFSGSHVQHLLERNANR
jgi:hypothetical protein